jgi:hypothetical protein
MPAGADRSFSSDFANNSHGIATSHPTVPKMNQRRKDRPRIRANAPVAVPVQIKKTNHGIGSQYIVGTFARIFLNYDRMLDQGERIVNKARKTGAFPPH